MRWQCLENREDSPRDLWMSSQMHSAGSVVADRQWNVIAVDLVRLTWFCKMSFLGLLWAKPGNVIIYLPGISIINLLCPGLYPVVSEGASLLSSSISLKESRIDQGWAIFFGVLKITGSFHPSFSYRERMTKEKHQPVSREDQGKVQRIHGSLCSSSSSPPPSPALLAQWRLWPIKGNCC